MKIGVFTAVFGDKDFEEVLDSVKDLGLEAVEVGAGNFAGKQYCDPETLLNDKDELNKFKNKISKRGLVLSALNCSGNTLHPDKSYAEANVKDLRQAIELAGILEVPVVNTFGGCPGADEGSHVPNWITCPWPPYYADAIKWQWGKKLLPFWKEMAPYARKHKVRFGFEMHPGDMIYNPELLLELREEIGMEEIACNFDPSHLFWQGIDPLVAVRDLKDLIVHIHAKDTRVDEYIVEKRGVLDWKHYSEVFRRAWNFRTIGYGHDLKFWNDFISLLKTIGYDYVISIEHEDPLMAPDEGLEKAVDLLKKAIIHKDPGSMWWA
jgi:sugar phosphate isomerase/epimerase